MTDAALERAARRRQEVFTACDELEEEGRPVSIKNVVAAIGGSNSTAAKYIKEWKADRFRESPASDPELYELTKAIRDKAMRVVEDKLEQAREQARRAEEKAAEAHQAAESAMLRAEEAEARRVEAELQARDANTRAENAEEARVKAVGEKDGFRNSQEQAAGIMQKVTTDLKEAVKAAAVERQELIERISAMEDGAGKIAQEVREAGQAPEVAAKAVQRCVAELNESVTDGLAANDRMLADARKEFSTALKTISESAARTQEAAIASAAKKAADAVIGQMHSYHEYLDNRIRELESTVADRIKVMAKAQSKQGQKILAMERKLKKKEGKDE